MVVTDNLYNSSEETLNRIELICGKRPDFFQADVTKEGAFDAIFEKHPDIDSVIHFAALKVRSKGSSTPRWNTKPAELKDPTPWSNSPLTPWHMSQPLH